ncbi:Cadherin EGF LAG seven-pass G-type receptor 3 [Bienertia sinuspersici]
MVEVKFNQDFPDHVEFQDEKGNRRRALLHYEWKPILCSNCHKVGHSLHECYHKKEIKQGQKQRLRKASENTQGQEKNNVVETGRVKISKETTTNRTTPSAAITSGDEMVLARTSQNKEGNGSNQAQIPVTEGGTQASNLGSLYRRVFGGWCFTSNSDEHCNGRIILAWNPKSFKVIILDKTAQMIHCVMQPCGGRNEFYCTFIYAFNEAIKREQLWQQLCELNSRQKGPWVLMGDFNVVMNSEERIGSNVRSRAGHKPFKYFRMWSNAGDFNERIANAWRWSGSGTNMYCLIKKLKKVKGTLIELNRRGFCELHAGVTKALMQMTEAQTKLQQRPLDNNLIMAERTAAKEYQERNKVYMQFLRQKAKCCWIKDGDENTALFH